MITLHGFAISNYYNKVKLVLLEKGLPFEEKYLGVNSADEAVLCATPLAKVPYISTEQGTLCESEVIVEYLEALCPTPALLPAEPFAAAKVRELVTFIELHLELVARELYAQAFFGGTVPEEVQQRVGKQLRRNIAGFKRLARFAPYVGGDTFNLADCAAYVSLPLVAGASKAVYGEDLLMAAGVDWKAHGQLVGARRSAQKVAADRKTAMASRG